MRSRSWLWVAVMVAALSARQPVVAADEPSAVNGNLHFRTDASARFELVEARFALDGEPLPTVISNAERGKDYVIVAQPLSPGRHVLTADLRYRPRERKVFTYVNGYRFNVRSEEVLTALPDHSATFTIVGTENKGVSTPIERALGVKVETALAPPEPGDSNSGLPGTEGDEHP
ncbi:MAG TPA: hypothetical protein VMU50_20380 [Polyangia bacterium]|nr:hypothetical protein [Polyangia bacterium]